MDFELFNTYSNKTELFIPLDDNDIRIYACGPTVYDYIHVGNARPLIIFDVLVRFLKLIYPKVTYVRNITDVDDKIIVQANQNKESINNLTERTIRLFQMMPMHYLLKNQILNLALPNIFKKCLK